MSVRAGREFLAIPGPTTVPDEVLRAMHRPAVDIYSGPLLSLTDSLLKDVARVFQTKGRSYIYISNGHGAWEASLTNVLSKGDKILVLESGRFAIGWGESARRMGVEVEILKGDMRRAVRPAEVEARLRADKEGTIKAVLVAQIDTASGVVNDIEAIGKAMKAARHDALLMVDAVASLGCMPFEMDKWGVDVAMSGSQKGMMTPPGLSFVAANDRAHAAFAQAIAALPEERRRERWYGEGDEWWSLYEIVAHLAAWEDGFATALDLAVRGERPQVPGYDSSLEDATDRFNATVTYALADVTWNGLLVRLELAAEHHDAALRSVVGALTPDRFEAGRSARRLADAANHYDEHTPAILDWRRREGI